MGWIAQDQGDRASYEASAPFAATRNHTEAAARAFLGRVYKYMAAGLATTGVVALAVASTPALLAFFIGNRGVFVGLLIGQLIMVMTFSGLATRVSAVTAAAMFFGYSALSGITFASIFLIYTAGSIGSTFLVTAGMFGGLSAYGAVTHRKLDGLGAFAGMGLVGVLLASLVNMFLGSPMLYWLITFAGVIVFTGLALYDTRKLRALHAEFVGGRDQETKLALAGALMLYLDFINMFMMLLRVLGGRRRD